MDLSKIRENIQSIKRGRPYLNLIKKYANPSKIESLKSIYNRISERSFRIGNKSMYKKKDHTIEMICEKYKFSSKALSCYINRSKKLRTTRKSRSEI